MILRGLKSVKLHYGNIAEVVFEGEESVKWVNLYTMQEFDCCPAIERVGFMDMLKVGCDYFFYKNRWLAGIPVREWRCSADGKTFMFMDKYVILSKNRNIVYRIEGDCLEKIMQ